MTVPKQANDCEEHVENYLATLTSGSWNMVNCPRTTPANETNQAPLQVSQTLLLANCQTGATYVQCHKALALQGFAQQVLVTQSIA